MAEFDITAGRRGDAAGPIKVAFYSASHERVGEIEVAGEVFGRTGDT